MKRVIVPISFSFSIRYIVRTGFLEELRKFAEPVVILTWNQEDLIEELKHKGFEVHVLPEVKQGIWYKNARRKLDYWFAHFQIKSPTRHIQETFLKQYQAKSKKRINILTKWYNIFKFYLPGTTSKLLKAEKELLHTDCNFAEISDWLRKLNAQAVFTVTPFHLQEDLMLRACSELGMKMHTAILSFDNITKRDWIPVAYDTYLVWNKYNLQELHRIYPYTKQKKVIISGAPQFDFYKKTQYLLPKESWESLVGLPINNQRKIILYAGGPKSLFPNEPQYLKHIDEAITNGTIKGNPIVLFRCHPVDLVQRWKDALGNSKNIVFDISWTGKGALVNVNVTDADIQKLCSTLKYTDVHINLCSTMTVDGSAYNKPQIGPAYDENGRRASRLLKSMYFQEHFLPIMKTNSLLLANSKEELIKYINQALINPESFTANNNKILEEIITYADGKSTERLLDNLRGALA